MGDDCCDNPENCAAHTCPDGFEKNSDTYCTRSSCDNCCKLSYSWKEVSDECPNGWSTGSCVAEAASTVSVTVTCEDYFGMVASDDSLCNQSKPDDVNQCPAVECTVDCSGVCKEQAGWKIKTGATGNSVEDCCERTTCNDNPCLNGGSCIDDPGTDGPQFQCDCPDSFFGLLCEVVHVCTLPEDPSPGSPYDCSFFNQYPTYCDYGLMYFGFDANALCCGCEDLSNICLCGPDEVDDGVCDQDDVKTVSFSSKIRRSLMVTIVMWMIHVICTGNVRMTYLLKIFMDRIVFGMSNILYIVV